MVCEPWFYFQLSSSVASFFQTLNVSFILQLLKQNNEKLESRAQLVTNFKLGSKVFLNSAGFIKIEHHRDDSYVAFYLKNRTARANAKHNNDITKTTFPHRINEPRTRVYITILQICLFNDFVTLAECYFCHAGIIPDVFSFRLNLQVVRKCATAGFYQNTS